MTTTAPASALHLDIRIDRATCIGSGQCVHWAPGTFDQDREAKAFVRARSGDSEALVLKAMQSCPVEAITIEVGGVVVGPRDVANWVVGAVSDDPVVERLAGLADAHAALSELIERAVASDEDRDDGRDGDRNEARGALVAAVSAHLRDELDAYLDLGQLVAPELLDAFVSGHARIDAALREVADPTPASPVDVDRRRLARALDAIDEQIRLEESVLFPLALASIVRRESGAG